MIKTIFLLFILTSNFVFCQDSTENDCSNYRTGDFFVVVGSDTCFISRTEDRQKEKCNDSDTEYELIVIWLKKDKYILRDIHYNPSTKPAVMRHDVVMSIMEKGTNYHIVNVKVKGERNRLMTVYCNK